MRTSKDIIAGMEPPHKGRAKTVAEYARREAFLEACDEIEALLANEGDFPDFAGIMRTWVKGTRESVAEQ
jgi:hypothetical protein